MGYRGGDAFPPRAESRRQQPWQSPDGEYDDYDAYAEQAGQNGYGNDGFGETDGYGQDAGYGYPQADGYGASGAQPGMRGGYGSAGYPAQDRFDRSGGYPTRAEGHAIESGGYGQSGGYPAPGDGADGEDVPGRYAGNDWYGRPKGASGSGFADTGTYNLDARIIDSYGTDSYSTGPRPAPEAADPPGMVHTGQQEVLDDQYEQYGSYPGYDDRGGYEAAGGYGQDDYDQDDYGQDDYDQDDYDQGGQGYDEPDPAGTGGRTKKKRAGRPGRGKRRLILGAVAVVVLAVIAGAGYFFVLKPKPAPASSASTGPLPSPGTTSAATAACVKKLGQYCHIQLRTDDPKPLTLAELFPPGFTNETDHGSFARVATKLDTTCSNAVIGQDIVAALKDGQCTQVLRASYVSGDNKIMATIGVANLSTTNGAHKAGKFVGQNDFVTPLSTAKGAASKLGKGTGIVEAEFKGHYLIMIWAQFTSTTAPANNGQDQQLQQFGNDLIAGTANISLSQRMVNGAPATAATSPG